MAHIRTKLVSWRELKPGMRVETVRSGCMISMAKYTVKSANMSTVTLLRWGEEEVRYNSEETMFEIEIPRDEFEKRHKTITEELVAALKIELAEYEIGPHVMDNSWISYDLYEMAVRLTEQKAKVVGICREIATKDPGNKWPADIAVVCESDDGKRFWCHASSMHLDLALDMYLNP